MVSGLLTNVLEPLFEPIKTNVDDDSINKDWCGNKRQKPDHHLLIDLDRVHIYTVISISYHPDSLAIGYERIQARLCASSTCKE